MKEVRLVEAGKFEINEVPMPNVGREEVLLKVEYVGICGSDLHIYEGKNALVALPRRLGHEFSGTVLDFGQDVRKLEGNSGLNILVAGDMVTVEPTIGCMSCEPCIARRRNHCDSLKIYGCQVDGAMTEYVAVPRYMVHKIHLPFESGDENMRHAALAEPAAVGIHSAMRAGINPNNIRRYFVLGAGVTGLMAMSAIKYLSKGDAYVAASDLCKPRLDIAKSLGFADDTILPESTDATALVRAMEHEKMFRDGFDCVIDAVGGGKSLETAILLGRNGCGRIVQLGVTSTPQNILQNLRKETTIVGSRVYNSSDFASALEMLSNSKLRQLLTTQDTAGNEQIIVFNGLENIVDAIETAKSGKHMKVMIKVD